MDFATIKSRQQHTWASGDYARVAVPLVIASELLCEAIELRAAQRVLDVATGSGNTALAAARRWCEVTGLDFVPQLLERAGERARAERLPVDFVEGDAESIPFPDAGFDAVTSTFGVMFAPNQECAASEMLRVCRPGGKIGMANWTPDGFVGEWFRTSARYVPPAAGLPSPLAWGTEPRLRELFGARIGSLHVVRRSVLFRYPSAGHWLDFFRTNFGPMIKTFEALEEAQQKNLAAELLDLIRRYNRSRDDTILAPGDYLEVVVTTA